EQTGATREGLSGSDGGATFPALPLTGTYAVAVSKSVFADDARSGLALRSSEVATVRVMLLVTGSTSQVTVYGPDSGVRVHPKFGWTAGPSFNIITKSGTNQTRGEALYLGRPGSWQTKTFPTDNFCAPSVQSCVTPTTLQAISPTDVPDQLHQGSASIGGALVK